MKKFIKKKLNQINRNKIKLKGRGVDRKSLKSFYDEIGIEKGDSLLVHSSLKKLGYVFDGPKTIVESLLDQIGYSDEGTLLMPSFPNQTFGYEYLKNNNVFDVKNTPSRMGVITEYFRTNYNCSRSYHPTHSIISIGKNAKYFTKDHHKDITPFTKKSPFYKLTKKKGKILLFGVKFDSLTSLHLLEDAVVDFKFDIYKDEIFKIDIIGDTKFKMKTKAHNPKFSTLRRCNDLEDLFDKNDVFKSSFLGNCKCYLIDALKMYEVMIEAYKENFTTMYTPYGISKSTT